MDFENNPAQYNLSNELKNLTKKDKMTRIDVLKFINNYIKSNNLIKSKEKNFLILDDNLKSIFGNQEKIEIFEINKYLQNHLFKDNLIKLNIDINKQNKDKLYDIVLNINSNEIISTMPFYVQKLIMEEKDRELIKNYPSKCNKFIVNNNNILLFEKKILLETEKLENTIKKRFEINNFLKNSYEFLNLFNKKQKKIQEACKIQKNLFLEKRVYSESQIISNIPKLYPNLYEKEILRVIEEN